MVYIAISDLEAQKITAGAVSHGKVSGDITKVLLSCPWSSGGLWAGAIHESLDGSKVAFTDKEGKE